METELEIRDGILQKCNCDKTQVVIPSVVHAVYRHAFDECPDVNIINLYPGYAESELSRRIASMLCMVAEGWDSESYTPCFPVYNINTVLLEKAIGIALKKIKAEFPSIEWKLKTIEADKIGQLRVAKEKGYDIASIYNLPTEAAARDDYGILYLKGINQENYDRSMGLNVDYNLIRSYSFLGYPLSYRWLVIIGSDVRLDASDTFSAFGRDCCWIKDPKVYIEYMDSVGKVID